MSEKFIAVDVNTGSLVLKNSTDSGPSVNKIVSTNATGKIDSSLVSGGSGTGDMEKSIYDTNNNGKVDVAEVAESANSVTWNGVQNKPTSFNPSTHTHTVSDITNISTEISSNTDVAANTSARHTHSNIFILNGTTESFTTELKNKINSLSNYTHPDNHPATMITEDTTHRFVTDTQITSWNNAASASGNGDMLKSTYDTNNNGKVDVAEVAESILWENVSNKPGANVTAIDNAVTNSHVRTHAINNSLDHSNADSTDYGKFVKANSVNGAIEYNVITESDLPNTIAKTTDLHSHSNKTLLDSYTQTEVNLSDAVSKKHAHANQSALDKVGESEGNPTWNGSAWPGGSGGTSTSDPLTPIYLSSYTNATWTDVYTATQNCTLRFASIINRGSSASNIQMRIVESNGTTLVHDVYPIMNLAGYSGIENNFSYYQINNGQKIQYKSEIQNTECYITIGNSIGDQSYNNTYTANTWTDLYTNSSSNNKLIRLVSIVNSSTTNDINLGMRVTNNAGTILYSLLPPVTLKAWKSLENHSSRFVIGPTQKIQIMGTNTGLEFFVTLVDAI